jgi:cyanophycin synthetase
MIECSRMLKLRGPNLWATTPLLEVWLELDIELLNRSKPKDIRERLSLLVESPSEDHSLEVSIAPSTVAGWLLEIAANAQRKAGYPARIRKVLERSTVPRLRILLEMPEEPATLACWDYAVRSLGQAWEAPSQESLLRWRDQNTEALLEQIYDACLGPSSKAILRAADARGIPWRRLSEGSLVQLGQGVKQRRICTAEADSTSAIAETIAQDKQLTRTLLASVGVPVPEGRSVATLEEALAAADEIGGLVVVKPQYGNHGRGVTTKIHGKEAVTSAYQAAREHGDWVVVESYSPGDDYRMLVVGNRLVAAARREPAHVIADGRSTISQLVAQVNRDPRRSNGHATSLSHIPLDAVSMAVLLQQGYQVDSIPPSGTKVLIRRNANLSTGGTAVDVTDLVHPEVARAAVDAARVVGLDIAGVDIIATDISIPLQSQHGAVVEVNAGPGLRMHLEPSSGQPRPVGEAIIDLVFPDGANGRIPVVAVTGVNGKTTTTRLIAHLISLDGTRVGMTCTEGIYVGGRRIESGDCSGPQSARSVLLHPDVQAAVLETARGGMLREGIGVDRCDVGVVTNVGLGDHLGLGGIDTVEQLAEVKRIVARTVHSHGHVVLNATDPLVVAMAPHCEGKIIYFGVDGEHPVIQEHRRAGGRACYIKDQSITLAEGDLEIRLLALQRIPLTHQGKISFQVENALAATAACWSLGMPAEQIRLGLESFSSHGDKLPGRFNILEIQGATAVLDYGHNVSSLVAILQALNQFPHQERTVVYSAAGDRRDEDMIAQGKILGDAFDRVILYEDTFTRGRERGEIIDLFRHGILQGSRAKQIDGFHSWEEAMDAALKVALPGQLLLLQADGIDAAMDYVRNRIQQLKEPPYPTPGLVQPPRNS